jgi:hypothetical protein
VQVGNQDFAIDLVFFHRGLACLVAFELKVRKFEPEDIGKLSFYVEAMDRDVKKPHERPSMSQTPRALRPARPGRARQGVPSRASRRPQATKVGAEETSNQAQAASEMTAVLPPVTRTLLERAAVNNGFDQEQWHRGRVFRDAL